MRMTLRSNQWIERDPCCLTLPGARVTKHMRCFDNGAFSGGYPLDAVIFNDCGDRVLSAVCEYNSATFLVKSFDYDVFGSAPSEARRFLRGASPRRARTSHPLVPSVGTMEEESNPNEVV